MAQERHFVLCKKGKNLPASGSKHGSSKGETDEREILSKMPENYNLA